MADPGKNAEPVVITGVGLMTAVGHRAPQAATSLRAGIARIGEYPEYEPIVREPGMMFPEPATAAPVSGVTDRLSRIERLFALGVPALREAIQDAGLEGKDFARTAL